MAKETGKDNLRNLSTDTNRFDKNLLAKRQVDEEHSLHKTWKFDRLSNIEHDGILKQNNTATFY